MTAPPVGRPSSHRVPRHLIVVEVVSRDSAVRLIVPKIEWCTALSGDDLSSPTSLMRDPCSSNALLLAPSALHCSSPARIRSGHPPTRPQISVPPLLEVSQMFRFTCSLTTATSGVYVTNAPHPLVGSLVYEVAMLKEGHSYRFSSHRVSSG